MAGGGVAGAQVDACREAGFSSALACSVCKQLPEFQLSHLEADCAKCCTGQEAAAEGL